MKPRSREGAGGIAAARVSTTILTPRPGAARLLLRHAAGLPAEAAECEMAIDTEDGALVLGPFAEVDAIALWRGLAAATGAVPVIESPAGERLALQSQLGRLQVSGIHHRRRTPAAGRKRPRFLVRRKAGRMPARPLVYRESEIATGRGA